MQLQPGVGIDTTACQIRLGQRPAHYRVIAPPPLGAPLLPDVNMMTNGSLGVTVAASASTIKPAN